MGAHQQFDLDAFFLRGLDLMLCGRHLRPAPPVKHLHLGGALPEGLTGRIDGHVATADDHYLLAGLDRLPGN